MGKCVSKHPSVLTIALSEKDLDFTAANQIWSRFAASSEYIIALKDAGPRNQLCEPEHCGDNQHQKQQWQRQKQSTVSQMHTEVNEKQLTSEQWHCKANKSGQWAINDNDKHKFDQDYDDVAVVVVEEEDDDGNDIAATAAVLVAKSGTSSSHIVNATISSDIALQAHKLRQRRQAPQHQDVCVPRPMRLWPQDAVANDDSGDDERVNVLANDKHDKNHKNNKHKEQQKQQQQQQQQQCAKENTKKSKAPKQPQRGEKVRRQKLQLINCALAHEPETESDEDAGSERLNCKSNGQNEDSWKRKEGQTESKRHAKKHGNNATAIETKGTAMSFGFRKKLNTTPKKFKKLLEGDIGKKKQDKCNNDTEDTVDKAGTVIETLQMEGSMQDDNGNAAGKVYFEKVGAAAASATQRNATPTTTATDPISGSPRPGAGNRFGYRGTNMVRPASTGLTPRYQSDMSENIANNNNCVGSGGQDGGTGAPKPLVSNLKRRSKSAHAGRTLTSTDEDASDGTERPKINQPKTITFNLNQNSTIEYRRQQFFQQPPPSTSGRVAWPTYHAPPQPQTPKTNVVNSGMHTNVIVRPTPRAPPATYSKFTLHTVSLPRPEFPVAISLSAQTPTTPGSTYTPSPTMAHNSKSASNKEHPLTAVTVANNVSLPSTHMDLKSAKQLANNTTRRGFSGSREISADSGIASMDMALDSSTSSGGGGGRVNASPKRSRSRPRNLQMVMNGRHKFEVRDLDDPLSSESNSFVEPLSLPKLPTENQTAPLPLCGLVRSNTVLSRESYERDNAAKQVQMEKTANGGVAGLVRNQSEESEGIDEEKLYLDRSTSEKSAKQHQFKDINTCSSKTSSPGSSIMLSWCNAGESLAAKDCSSLSISSSEDSNKLQDDKNKLQHKTENIPLDLNDDDLSIINTDMQVSTISSITETVPPTQTHENLEAQKPPDSFATFTLSTDSDIKLERPKSLYNSLNETKFAEMALAGSTYLLDDETSPTDSLVSSTESEEAATKQKKHKINEELQEKDIDEISPELEVGSPISPGTPTHASHSLSLSDCGNLIDDEIADQPALLFNSEAQEPLDVSRKDKTDTPTLMETTSLRSLKSQSKARSVLQQAIELSLRTPLSLRKAVMERAESLDTLSPCESICSEDLMMDFDMNSSVDSIDRSGSIKSRSGSDLNKIDETELFSELERKGSDMMKELNSIMRIHTSRNAEKDSVLAHLPARATRLLNRSRLQQQCPLNAANADSDSSKSPHSIRGRSAATSRASTGSNSTNASQPRSAHHYHNSHHNHHHAGGQRELHSSSDDLMLYDKSFRNAMIQDVLQFKKQLLRLRRILQEDEDILTRTETLNPFDSDNGQIFASCGLDSKLLDDIDLVSLTSSTADDPMQELADLRRQVVYLQGQVEDRDRTIRLQRTQIENLEATKNNGLLGVHSIEQTKECINMATQTERTRPLSIGPEGLSRSKPEYTSYTTHFPAICGDATTIIQHQQQCPANNQTRRHTIISTTLTNYHNQQQQQQQQQNPLVSSAASRRASIAWEKPSAPTTTPAIYKPVKITLIGEPLKQWPPALVSANANGNGECKQQQKQPQMLSNGNKQGDLQTIQNNKLLLQAGTNGVRQGAQQQQQQINQLHSQITQHAQHYKMPLKTNGNYNPTVTIV